MASSFWLQLWRGIFFDDLLYKMLQKKTLHPVQQTDSSSILDALFLRIRLTWFDLILFMLWANMALFRIKSIVWSISLILILWFKRGWTLGWSLCFIKICLWFSPLKRQGLLGFMYVSKIKDHHYYRINMNAN